MHRGEMKRSDAYRGADRGKRAMGIRVIVRGSVERHIMANPRMAEAVKSPDSPARIVLLPFSLKGPTARRHVCN